MSVNVAIVASSVGLRISMHVLNSARVLADDQRHVQRIF